MDAKTKERFKQLKRERNKWWKETVPHTENNLPRDKSETVPAFHLSNDGSIIEVRAWVDNHNFKRAAQLSGSKKYHSYTSGRTWPTKEGALLDKADRAVRHLDKCRKAHEEANTRVIKTFNELKAYLEEKNRDERIQIP